jgi:hypothetical protein
MTRPKLADYSSPEGRAEWQAYVDRFAAEHPAEKLPVILRADPWIDAQAARFMRDHRHTFDTSEALDDLRQLLAAAQDRGAKSR